MEAPDARLQTPFERPGKRHNYFVRHWQGELPLWISYWLNGFILTVAVAVVDTVVTNSINLKDEFYPAIALWVVVGMWMGCLLVYAWQSVGIWRSAKRYKQKKLFWGGVAQLAVILGIFRAVIDFGTHGLPQINELFSIYLGDQRLGTYAVRIQQGGRVLEFSGVITFGAAQEFGRFLDSMSDVEEVRLESNGGRILEAQRIGTLIRSRGLNTYVPDHCFSACTHIFLSGRDRVVGPGGKLGFHQPDFPGLSDEQRRLIVAEEGKRLQELGVSEAFTRKALSTPSNEIWIPTSAQLISEGIATRVVKLPGASPKTLNQTPVTPEHPDYDKDVVAQSTSGPFDGRWSATVGPQGACRVTSILILGVVGSSIVGNATNPSGVFPLSGAVNPSGTGVFKIGGFVGTVRFSGTTFEANYANSCGGRFATGTKRD